VEEGNGGWLTGNPQSEKEGYLVNREWPYLWLDVTYVKARRNHRVVSIAVAVAVTTDGRREIIRLGIGPSEAEPF